MKQEKKDLRCEEIFDLVPALSNSKRSQSRACISSGAQHSFRSAAAKDEVSEESADDEF